MFDAFDLCGRSGVDLRGLFENAYGWWFYLQIICHLII